MLLALLLAAAPQQGTARLAAIRNGVAARGARAVIADLLANGAEWDSVLEEVGSGRREWLAVAEALYPASDAHAAESLQLALQEALALNAEGTLGDR